MIGKIDDMNHHAANVVVVGVVVFVVVVVVQTRPGRIWLDAFKHEPFRTTMAYYY